MRRRQKLEWIFRAERAGPPRWVSGRSEGARRRAGAHPRPRQQRREAADGGGTEATAEWMGTTTHVAVITLRSLVSPPLSVSYIFTYAPCASFEEGC